MTATIEELEKRIGSIDKRLELVEDLEDTKGEIWEILNKHLSQALLEITLARAKAEKDEGITDAY